MMIGASHDTYSESMQKLKRLFMEETGRTTFRTMDLAVWAIANGHWEPPHDLVLRKCREDFSRALREEQIHDQYGRAIRANYVARITQGDRQLFLWVDIKDISHEHFEVSFDQRRKQVVGDCRQMDRDADYYESIHPDRPKIQRYWDFTDDVEEGRFPSEYPPKEPN